MVNLDRLRASGCTQERLKEVFTNFEDPETIKLVEMLRDALRSGVEKNLRDYRLFWAMDKAMDTHFYQASYTQLHGLIDGKPDENKVKEMVNRWGLTHLLLPQMNPETGKPVCNAAGTPQKSLNIPVFFQVLVPLCSAYVTIRWAKLFNDRNLTPLYKYEPAKFTKANRMRCEIITEIMQMMATNYNYRDDERQAILQTLIYSFCIKFPRESWHKVEHEDEDGKLKIVKEGLRFHMPHPSRTFVDQFYRPSTINSDTGCRYMGYWEIRPYRDVQRNKSYWNIDKVSYGVNTWFSQLHPQDFFTTVYPCVLRFPELSASSTSGAGEMDRENAAAFYGTADSDAATLASEIFYKLVPSEHGLGDYKQPVWFRFVMANDNAVLWAEPIPYTPGAFYGYDYDGNRARNKSLTMEVLPFQDLIGQTLSQWIMSVKQNLVSPIFVNTDLVGAEITSVLENLGGKLYEGRTWIPFSATQNRALDLDERQAFYAPQLSKHDTAQLATLIKGMLDILERVLVLSSQEIGQPASHEQTAEEVRSIGENTSTRVQFTGSYIDEGIYATKKMLYDAWIAFGEEDFAASVSQNYAATPADFDKLLKDLGLILDEDTDTADQTAQGKRLVKGKKEAVELVSFASTRDAADRINNAQIATAMAQIFQNVQANPMLVQVLGVDQLIDLLNAIITMAGLPKDFKLRPANHQQSPEQQANAFQQQLMEMAKKVKEAIDQSAEQTAQAVLGQTAKALQPIGQEVQALAVENKQQDAQLLELKATLAKVTQVLAAAASRPPMPPSMPPPEPQYMTAPPEPNELSNPALGQSPVGQVEETVGMS